MGWPYLGRGGALGLGAEVTHGTAVSRTIWLPLVSESMKRTVEKVRRGTLYDHSAARVSRKHYVKADNAGGSVTVLMTYEGFGLLLKHILWGTPTTTGTNPYTHTCKLSGTLPTAGLTMEVVRGTGSAEVFEGCRITKAVWKIAAGGLLEVTLDVIAETSGGRTSAGSPSFTTSRDLPILHHHAGTLGWNSLTKTLKSWELTIDSKLTHRNLLGSKLTADPAPGDYTEVMAKIELEWDADDFNTGLTADTESDATIAFTDGTNTATFNLHNAYVDDVSDPVGNVGVISQSVTLKGQDDGTDYGLSVVLVNTQSSALTG